MLWTHRSLTAYVLCIILLCVLTYSRATYVAQKADVRLEAAVNTSIVVQGRIVAEPDIRASSSYYVVELDEYDVRIRVTLGVVPALAYGDYVQLSGTLLFPENIRGSTGRVFDYAGFLSKDGIRYTMRRPRVEVLVTSSKHTVRTALFTVKQKFVSTLSYTLGQPHGALAAGILLGTKQSLGDALLDAFRRAGLVHIVVLSGFNVTIIAEAIRRFFHRCKPQVSMLLTITCIIAFAIMTGASATTVRASIMAILAVIALRSARTYDVHRALVLAGVCMVLHNPRLVQHDPGFQLSFVATIGLLFLAPILERWMQCVPERFALRQIVSTTVATQLTVLPLLSSMTGEVSLISLLANVLVLPVVPFAMGLSAVVMALGKVGVLLLPISLLTKVALDWIMSVAMLCARVPFAVLTLPAL